jgi:hypothetical protein
MNIEASRYGSTRRFPNTNNGYNREAEERAAAAAEFLAQKEEQRNNLWNAALDQGPIGNDALARAKASLRQEIATRQQQNWQ